MLQRLLVFFSLVIAVASPPLLAGQSVRTCAVLSDGSSAAAKVSAIVEQELLADGTLKLVDRQLIQQRFAEKNLQAVLGPAALRERAAIGKLLQADLLVIIGEVPGHPDTLSWTICETRMGLRLASMLVPVTDAARAPAEIEKAVRRAAAINLDTATICAVPPMKNDAIAVKFSPFTAQFTQALEAHLAERENTVVVELDEARAIAEEISLGTGKNIVRPMPLYFTSHYWAHLQEDGSRLVRIIMTLQQGQNELGLVEELDIPFAKAPSEFGVVADQLLAKAGAQIRSTTRPAIASATTQPSSQPSTRPVMDEAAILLGRAENMRRLGYYSNALKLVEASLLLRPEQPIAHREAARYVALWLKGTDGIGQTTDPLKDEQRRPLFYVGLSHLEAHMCTSKAKRGVPEPLTTHYVIEELLTCQNSLPDIPGSKDSKAALATDLVNMARRIAAAKAQRGEDDLSLLFFSQFVDWTEGTGSRAVGFANKLKIVSESQAMFSTAGSVVVFLVFDHPKKYRVDSPELRDALRSLEALKVPRFDEAATTMRSRLDHAQDAFNGRPLAESSTTQSTTSTEASPATRPAMPRAIREGLTITAAGHVRFVPLTLAVDGRKPTTMPADSSIIGWIPAGPGVEALWTNRDLYLMRQAGHVQHVCSIGSSGVTFDGQFLWATGPGKELELLVIAPETGRCKPLVLPQEVAPISEDLEPKFTSRVLLAGIAPGKVEMAAGFGRGWVGTMTFDNQTDEGLFHGFFQARRPPDKNDPEEWKFRNLAFDPLYMYALSVPATEHGGSAKIRVLLGRSCGHEFDVYHPLLIDEVPKNAEVVQEPVRVPHKTPRLYCDGQFVYWCDYYEKPGPHVLKLDPRDGKRHVVGEPPFYGAVGKTENGYVIYDGNWWAFCPELTGPYTIMQGASPVWGDGVRLMYSRFHGAVISGGADGGVSRLEHDPILQPANSPATAPSHGN